jgi:hypothetical protein
MHSRYLIQVATVVSTPSISSMTTPLPYNVPELRLAVENIDGSVRADEVEVILQIGDGVACPIISISNGSITCNTTAVNATLFGYRAPLTAQVYRATGPSAPAIVATIVSRPSISKNGASNKIATSSSSVSIIGSNFGSNSSILSVTIAAVAGRRRASLDVSAPILSASDTQIVVGLPQNSFAPGSSLVATVYLSGAPSEPIPIGSVVPAPTLTPNTSYKIATNAPIITLSGTSFSEFINATSVALDANSVNSTISCRVISASLTKITCSLTDPLRVGPLFAVVTANGGPSTREQVAQTVDAPTIRGSSTDPIKLGALEVSISGEGFNGAEPSSNLVELAYNTQDGSPTKSCAVDASRSSNQLLVCALSSSGDLNITGSLFARVQSYDGRTNWTQIGVVSDPSGIVGPVSPGIIAVIVVVVVVLVVIVIVGAVLGYRYVKGIRERNQQKVPKEMEYMFNIRASDLQILNKLGEGSFGAVYFGKYKGRHVAIKKLAASVLGQQVADFFREAALMGAVEPHPYEPYSILVPAFAESHLVSDAATSCALMVCARSLDTFPWCVNTIIHMTTFLSSCDSICLNRSWNFCLEVVWMDFCMN